MGGDIFEIYVNLAGTQKISNFKSDGYWQCAEIQGTLSTRQKFLCHSTDEEHAFKILKVTSSGFRIPRIEIF